MATIRYRDFLFEHEIADVERMGHKPVEPGHLPLFRYVPRNIDFFGGLDPRFALIIYEKHHSMQNHN